MARGKITRILALGIFILIHLSGCGNHSGSHFSASEDENQGSFTPPPGPPEFNFQALLWEKPQPSTKMWSQYVFKLLQAEAKTLLEADDFDIFCPKYKFLNDSQKVNVAGMLISAMVQFESEFKPTARLKEPSLGIDQITGQTVYSEGLLQLSYQDTKGWPFCRFDWAKDRSLSPTDPRKTILDPYRNLECGVRILAKQVEKRGQLVIGNGAYWAVIKENGSHEKIHEISNLVKSLQYCR